MTDRAIYVGSRIVGKRDIQMRWIEQYLAEGKSVKLVRPMRSVYHKLMVEEKKKHFCRLCGKPIKKGIACRLCEQSLTPSEYVGDQWRRRRR